MSAAVWLGAPAAEHHFDPEALNETDRQRYAGLRGTRRRQEFAVSRALRAAALDGPPGVTSLSHSGGWAAVAHGPENCRLGVDIEFHRTRDVLGIARFAFDATEIAALELLGGSERMRLFYALWTMKEAMAKALGVPLLVASRQCVFAAGTAGWRGRAPIDEPWQVQAFGPRADLALAVVVIGNAGRGPIATYEWPPAVSVSWELIAAVRSDSDAV